MSVPQNTSSSGLFTGSSNVSISGGNFNYIQICECESRDVQNGWERLFQNIDTNAIHNSLTRRMTSKSVPQKYEALLWRIMDWARDSQVIEHSLWAYALPGASFMAQAVSNLHEQNHTPLATYFVGKDPDNEDVRERFIPTIAYQLGLSFPRVREYIGNTVAHDPAILSRSVSHQLESLILQPLAPILSVSDGVIDSQHRPTLIIVEGCDYLDDYTRSCIVNALLRIAQQYPLRVRILLFTKSSVRIATLASGLESGLVAEIGFHDERSIYAIVEQVWKRLKNVVRIHCRA